MLRTASLSMRPPLSIISSIKPLIDDDFYSKCQRNAVSSWDGIGGTFLFNNPDDLRTRDFGFHGICVKPTSNPPTIKEMLDWYSPDKGRSDDGILILVNGDIVLSKDTWKIHNINEMCGRIWAATSFRHEFDGDKKNGVVDEGLDFFCMTKAMAARVASDIPDFLTLGRGLWDNWMNAWFRRNLPPQRYFDLTDWEIVHHPKHERVDGRLSGYTQEQTDQVLKHPKILPGGIPKIRYQKPA